MPEFWTQGRGERFGCREHEGSLLAELGQVDGTSFLQYPSDSVMKHQGPLERRKGGQEALRLTLDIYLENRETPGFFRNGRSDATTSVCNWTFPVLTPGTK